MARAALSEPDVGTATSRRPARRVGGWVARERRLHSAGLFAAAVVLCVVNVGSVRTQARQASAPVPIRIAVSYHARAIAPGEVVRIKVEPSVPVDTIVGRSPVGPVYFLQSSNPTVWEAFAGLDVGVKPGRYPITIRASAGGAVVEKTMMLTVRAKRFPVRRITLAERFAQPPASMLARIEREAKELTAILAGVSPDGTQGGGFVRPVPGNLTSPFGRLSIVNGEVRNPHSGADFAAVAGTPVTAPNAGRVVLSDGLYFAGETIVVDHGLGVYSLLAHLSQRDVEVGDIVEARQHVGLSGITGRITGPHLHWSVRLAGARIDPLSLVAVSGHKDPDVAPLAIHHHATLW